MMKYTTILFLLVSMVTNAQDSLKTKLVPPVGDAYVKGSYIGTIAIGFVNGYRTEYTVPSNFEKGNTTGFAPIYGKFEYAVSSRVSLAATAAFNSIYFNSFQLYTGYNGPIRRDRVNKFRIFNAGLTAYYHFGHIVHVNRLDPFVGVGLCLNNIKQTAFPEGDSTIIRKYHTATPYLKAGARYYVSDKVSVFADAGYDKTSIVSLGFSCRFLPKKNQPAK